MLFLFFIAAPTVFTIFGSNSFASLIEIQNFKNFGRVTFHLNQLEFSDWKNEKDHFEVFFPGANLADFGAPFGQEKKWLEQYEVLADERISGLRFEENYKGLRVIGKWRFPGGEKTLAHPSMIAFYFRQSEPLRFIVDFWLKEGHTLLEVKALELEKKKEAHAKAHDEKTKIRLHRRKGYEKLKAEEEDLTRFCHEPLAEKTDVFLKFYSHHKPFPFEKWINIKKPDNPYQYFEPKGTDRESQFMRLALSLYKKGDAALSVRTLDFFEAEFPETHFRRELIFLKANALIHLELQNQAEGHLKNLLQTAPGSQEALYAGLYLSLKQLYDRNYLNALDTFHLLMGRFANHKLNWMFHVGAAESLYALGQSEMASKEYQWVIENSMDKVSKYYSAFRIGDLYLNRFQYEQAIAAYYQAIQVFPEEAKSDPALQINRAEALYGLGNWDRAQEIFESFLNKFNGHSAGWRASFRIGEITGRKGRLQESRNWFLLTINHYPFSPGEVLAKLRLMPCFDHGGLNPKTGLQFLTTTAYHFGQPKERGEVALTHYQEFKALAEIRALANWGLEATSIDRAIEAFKSSQTSAIRGILEKMISVLFRKVVLGLLEKKKNFEALVFYSNKKEVLPRDETWINPDYLIYLSRAASDLRFGELAVLLASQHKQNYEKWKTGRGLAVTQPLESQDDTDLQLQTFERNYSEAKALWVSSGIKEESKIRSLLNDVKDESPFSYDKEVLLGLLEEKKKNLEKALRHGVKAQMLETQFHKSNYLKLHSWVAHLQDKVGNPELALENYLQLEKNSKPINQETSPQTKQGPGTNPGPGPENQAIDTLGLPPAFSLKRILSAQILILEKQNKWDEAIKTYERFIKTGLTGHEIQLGYARTLLKSSQPKNHDKATAILDQIKKAPVTAEPNAALNGLWRKLAQENIENLAIAKR